MAEITAKMVSDLRQRTGVGMMECKKALSETEGDMDAAIDALRKKGLAKAASKADREAKQGYVYIAKGDERHGTLFVVNCETDFVSGNEDFRSMVKELGDFINTADVPELLRGRMARGEQLDGLKALAYKGHTVGDEITAAVAKIGENIFIGACCVEHSNDPLDYLHSYIHGGRIGVLVCMTTGKPETQASEGFQDAARNLAFQIAAGVPRVPEAANREELDPAVVEKEKTFLIEQAMGEGKPEEIAQKMVEGRIGKFFGEIVLLEQPFIQDEKKTVSDYLKEVGSELGDTITVARFHRYELGG